MSCHLQLLNMTYEISYHLNFTYMAQLHNLLQNSGRWEVWLDPKLSGDQTKEKKKTCQVIENFENFIIEHNRKQPIFYAMQVYILQASWASTQPTF